MARSTPAQKPRGLASRTSITIRHRWRRSAARGPALAKAVEDQQHRADRDGAVGDVERRIRPAGIVKQQEVDDVADAQGGPTGCRARRRGSAPGRGSTALLPPRFSSQTMTTDAATAIAANSHRCQPSAPARKLNAAPGLNASARLKKLVTTRCSPGRNAARISALVAWSATITARLTPSQRHQRGGRPERCDTGRARSPARCGFRRSAAVRPAPTRFATQRPHRSRDAPGRRRRRRDSASSARTWHARSASRRSPAAAPRCDASPPT